VERVGRAAADITYSAAFAVCAGRTEAEIARRAAAISREVDELRANTPLVGTPAEIVDRLGPFADAGIARVYLQLLDMADLDHLELFASKVLPQLAGPD
jgi:alkanesulfonate monooxygenase SsuD/methylene tetrahydromethanopterin reductase-like flavin-dependent oxidoreductase (luciferase family)